MSLSSLLLSSREKVDTELDLLFKSNPTTSNKTTLASIPISSSSEHVIKKRKLALQPEHASVSKRVKSSASKTSKKSEKTQSERTPKTKRSKGENGSGKGKAKKVEQVEDEEDKSDLENAYFGAQLLHKSGASHDSEGEEEESDEEPNPPVHEALRKKKKHNRAGAKTKFVPADEAAERRDERTIFIGNIPVEVAQKKPLLKQLQQHILTQIPTAKIESTRFRSIPFQTPTSKLPTSDDEKTQTSKQGRAHDRERASTWREHKGENEKTDETGKSDEKKYLNPKQKKKIAFINQEFHSSADTVHAYVVFAHPLPPESRPKNLPPPPPTMDPHEAARLAAQRCDGTPFMDRIIRVDLINKVSSGDEKNPTEPSVLGSDPKLSVFVGNLDFASKEEDLRVFFEGVVSAERGPPDADSEDEASEAKKKLATWVFRVRIVRDKDTQLGKGFAYVQFTDRACVDEVLALDQSKLKFAKRTLRVQRCKTLPGSSTSTRHVTADAKPNNLISKSPAAVPVPAIIPKGDPSLGKKLAHMPKEERKQYKSSDADRVARRMAKKKARIALWNKGVKHLGKERERVRRDKGVGVDKGKGKGKGAATKESKGRVRSEKSLLKRNMKK